MKIPTYYLLKSLLYYAKFKGKKISVNASFHVFASFKERRALYILLVSVYMLCFFTNVHITEKGIRNIDVFHEGKCGFLWFY